MLRLFIKTTLTKKNIFRSFECLLHLSYRIDMFGKVPLFWQQRTPEQKELVKTRKNIIQAQLKEELSLGVNVPRSGSSGTSTTGNCARIAFRNAEKTAVILDINLELGKRLLLHISDRKILRLFL